MNTPSEWPEWVIRQDFTCVHVQAPSAAAAVEAAAKRLGTMRGWKVGPDVDQEVFPADEYRKHARLGDYTRSMIVASRPGTPTTSTTRAQGPEPEHARGPTQ